MSLRDIYFRFNHNLFNGQKQNNKAKINFVTETKVLKICPVHSKDLDLRKIKIFTKAITLIKFINGQLSKLYSNNNKIKSKKN